jgi:UDP-N-acetylglucosamine transferase subunit ALG13
MAVGTQFPFDRLVRFMDEWAEQFADGENPVIAQIGDGNYVPKNMQFERFMDAEQYNNHIRDAAVFVSHAGMGNIISAKELGTPIVVINRQFKLGEHRNDHQADGLKWMGKLEGVYAASDQDGLYAHINTILAAGKTDPAETRLSSGQHQGHLAITDYIADFILTGQR